MAGSYRTGPVTDPDRSASATATTGARRQRRIFIIGGPGSGKTWLAQRIGSALGLAVHHLDEVARVGGGNGPERSPVERLASVNAILLEQGWVAEGVHLEWTDRLLHGADLIIWLDHVSPRQAARRIVVRFVRTALAEVRRRPGLSKVTRIGDYIRNLRHLLAAVPESGRYYVSETRVGVAGNRADTAIRLGAHRHKLVHCRTIADVDDVVKQLFGASGTG